MVPNPSTCQRYVGRHLGEVWVGGIWNGCFPEYENIAESPKFPGKSLRFHRKRDFRQSNFEPDSNLETMSLPMVLEIASGVVADLPRKRSQASYIGKFFKGRYLSGP